MHKQTTIHPKAWFETLPETGDLNHGKPFSLKYRPTQSNFLRFLFIIFQIMDGFF